MKRTFDFTDAALNLMSHVTEWFVGDTASTVAKRVAHNLEKWFVQWQDEKVASLEDEVNKLKSEVSLLFAENKELKNKWK